jgi:hypothetical protein
VQLSDLISRPDFRSYRDISDVKTIAVEINWTFLITFPSAKAPEKQEIKFVARTKQLDSFETKGSERRRKVKFFDQLKIQEEDFYIEVYYSNMTWGEDMMNLVANHVGSTFSRRSRAFPNTINVLVKFAPVIAMMVFFYTTLQILRSSIFKIDNPFRERWRELAEAPVDMNLLNRKLDLAFFDRFSSSIFSYWDFSLPVIFTVLVVIPIFFLEYTLRRSFVELNIYTSKARKKYYESRTFVIAGLIITFLIGVAGNVFAAPIVSYLKF